MTGLSQSEPGAASGVPRPLPWMAWKVGQRVVVRRREADGLYDAVGELLEVAPGHVLIRTRKGDVRVPATKMVTGKIVPPPPVVFGAEGAAGRAADS